MNKCVHFPAFGPDTTMETVEDTSLYFVKKCKCCDEKQLFRRHIGKIDAYDINFKQKLDHERDRHRKELIQPRDKYGRVNDDFIRAYGYDPFKEEAPKVKQLKAEAKMQKNIRLSDKEQEAQAKIEESMAQEIESKIQLQPLPKKKK